MFTPGNLNPYMTSYMRQEADKTLTYTECSWVFALACMGQGLSMYFGGLIERKLGPRLTSLLGGWLMRYNTLASLDLTFYQSYNARSRKRSGKGSK